MDREHIPFTYKDLLEFFEDAQNGEAKAVHEMKWKFFQNLAQNSI